MVVEAATAAAFENTHPKPEQDLRSRWRSGTFRPDLEIRHGTFGLLGPNGAGKTTLIKILSTQMAPSAGAVEINGWDLQRDCAQVRRRLGYLPQHLGAYPQLSAWEFLDYMGRLGGLHDQRQRRERVAQALEDVGLYEVCERKTGTFSGGCGGGLASRR